MIFDICPWTKSDKLIQLLSQQHIDLQFDVFGNLMISMEWNCVEVSFFGMSRSQEWWEKMYFQHLSTTWTIWNYCAKPNQKAPAPIWGWCLQF